MSNNFAMNIAYNYYSPGKGSCFQKAQIWLKVKNTKAPQCGASSSSIWIRTRTNRTKICCATVTPWNYPSVYGSANVANPFLFSQFSR